MTLNPRYKIPEGHQLLMRNDGTFCFTNSDGYKIHEGPIFPLDYDKSKIGIDLVRFLKKMEELCD